MKCNTRSFCSFMESDAKSAVVDAADASEKSMPTTTSATLRFFMASTRGASASLCFTSPAALVTNMMRRRNERVPVHSCIKSSATISESMRSHAGPPGAGRSAGGVDGDAAGLESVALVPPDAGLGEPAGVEDGDPATGAWRSTILLKGSK